MMRKIQYIVFFSILLISCRESRVDWRPSYDSTETIPYGTQVLRKELENIFPDSEIENIQLKTLEHFEEIRYSTKIDHYVYINERDVHSIDTWYEISDYVYDGGSAFISMETSNPVLLNALGLSIDSHFKTAQNQAIEISVLDGEKESKYVLEKVFGTGYIVNYNPETTDVVGYVTYNGVKQPNFVKVYHGNGFFMVHTTPSVFTNYNMLRKNSYQYVVNAFSYLDDSNIMWDNHRIDRRSSGEKNDGGFFNALSYILKHESMRWAFYLLLTLGFMYLLFNSKRRQKAVPIVLPYNNYTLDFAKTLSELYRYNPDHTAMVRYKINYFLEQLKGQYNITAKETEKDFSEILSSKSGVDIFTCQKIVSTIDLFKAKSYLTKDDFYLLQTLIETFNQKSNSYGRPKSRK